MSASLVESAATLGLTDVVESTETQWVGKVHEWSSQYGDGKGNWGAVNIEGPPTFYPGFGDNVNTWAPLSKSGTEFVVLEYPKACVPEALNVYETFTPGALVKVSGGKTKDGPWTTLWNSEPDVSVKGKSRILKVSLIADDEPIVSFIRLDIDASSWDNWYEIDAVALVGRVITTGIPPYERPAPNTLAADLLSLFTAQSGDITIRAGTGEIIRAHKSIIQARCPLLLGAGGDYSGVYEVSDHPDVLDVLLTFIYSDTAPIPAALCIPIYAAADRYGLGNLAALSLRRFATALTPENVIEALRVVDGFSGLRAACFSFLAQRPVLLGNSARELTHDQLAGAVAALALASTAK